MWESRFSWLLNNENLQNAIDSQLNVLRELKANYEHEKYIHEKFLKSDEFDSKYKFNNIKKAYKLQISYDNYICQLNAFKTIYNATLETNEKYKIKNEVLLICNRNKSLKES